MTDEQIRKAYHLLAEREMMQRAIDLASKDHTTIEITGHPNTRTLLDASEREMLRRVLTIAADRVTQALQELGLVEQAPTEDAK